MPGFLRERSARLEQLQRQVHGGHDGRFRTLPANGSSETSAIQRSFIHSPKVPQYLRGPCVSVLVTNTQVSCDLTMGPGIRNAITTPF